MYKEIRWSPDISVGDVTIDDQHRQLLDQINKLQVAIVSDIANEVVTDIVGYLQNYILEHLNYEERYMEQHSYPDLENHKKIHHGFIEKYKDLQNKILTGKKETLVKEVQDFLGQWWIQHIKKEDKKYYEFIRDNNIHPEGESRDFHNKPQK